jgi:RNA polymerase sigma factor (sigma-70 family)
MTSTKAGNVLLHIRRLAGPGQNEVSADCQLLDRFTTQRDESAFAELVRQHGPMVLHVCRSVLRHEQDAEDAFQATFLVLARKADTIRQPEAVAGWLCEVAYRVAVKAHAASARRHAQERRDTLMSAADPTLDMTVRDLQRVLHEELRHLPDKYRVPLVLCYLEGRSHEEAARQLGWSKGTFRGRLDRGREHLRRRLAARGVALAAVLCGTAVAPAAAAEALVQAVVRVVAPSPLNGATGVLPGRVAALAEEVIRAMSTSKLKVVLLGLLALGMMAGAGVLAREAVGGGGHQKPATSTATASAKPHAAKSAATQAERGAAPRPMDEKNSIAFRGRVLDPDGKPAAGAKLYLTPWWGGAAWRDSPPVSATSGTDGRFAFRVLKAKYLEQAVVVTSTSDKHGASWVDVPGNATRENVTIRLVHDDVPINGQIVDLEARPVAGATLTVQQIDAGSGDDLGPWLNAVRNKKGLSLQLRSQHLRRHTTAVSTKVTTDEKGRFRLRGIGPNRLVSVRLDGPTIVSQRLSILTRPGKAFEVPDNEGNPEYGERRTVTVYYGANFQHVAAPSKPIVGVIRDRDTKKPPGGVHDPEHDAGDQPNPHRPHRQDKVRRTGTLPLDGHAKRNGQHDHGHSNAGLALRRAECEGARQPGPGRGNCRFRDAPRRVDRGPDHGQGDGQGGENVRRVLLDVQQPALARLPGFRRHLPAVVRGCDEGRWRVPNRWTSRSGFGRRVEGGQLPASY